MNEQYNPMQRAADQLAQRHAEAEREAEKQHGLRSDPWAGRQQGMRCRTCIWFVPKTPGGLANKPEAPIVGRCRRHAPSMGGYPVVYQTDWCGDHRVDENKV